MWFIKISQVQKVNNICKFRNVVLQERAIFQVLANKALQFLQTQPQV